MAAVASSWFAGPPVLDGVMTFSAVALVWVLPATLLYLWFGAEDAKVESVFVFVAVVVSILLSYGMGLVYSHPAPYVGHETLLSGPPENSFPSQHTTAIFAFAWSLFSIGRRRAGVAALGLATLLGVGRVYVGLHYPVDIVGGIVASLVGVALVSLARDGVSRFAEYCVAIETRLWAIVRPE